MIKSEELLENLKKHFRENNEYFFSYAWREKITEILDIEHKYMALVQWIDKQIENDMQCINILNPADKQCGYTNKQFLMYQDACKNVAMLLNFKYILLHIDCNVQMRANIEYTICKIFNIKYNEELKIYT